MDTVKILDHKDRLIKNLSKGYRQRVGLAQALVGNPPVLILDEPTIGLDPRQIIEIRNLIKELGKEHTIVLSSHILPEVTAVCERVIIIHRGRIVASDSIDKLSADMSGGHKLTVRVAGSEARALVGDPRRALGHERREPRQPRRGQHRHLRRVRRQRRTSAGRSSTPWPRRTARSS